MPNVLATTIVFKIAPNNRNMATAIWWVKKYARNWLKNLESENKICQIKPETEFETYKHLTVKLREQEN